MKYNIKVLTTCQFISNLLYTYSSKSYNRYIMLYIISAHNTLVYNNDLLSSGITTESNNTIFIITKYYYLLSDV